MNHKLLLQQTIIVVPSLSNVHVVYGCPCTKQPAAPMAVTNIEANNEQDHQHLVAVVQFPTHLFPMPFVTIRYTTPIDCPKYLREGGLHRAT